MLVFSLLCNLAVGPCNTQMAGCEADASACRFAGRRDWFFVFQTSKQLQVNFQCGPVAALMQVLSQGTQAVLVIDSMCTFAAG